MGNSISGIFATRREAEMAIERLVQNHGVPRQDVLVAPAGAENTAGTEPAGSDAKRGPVSPPPEDDSPLHGRIAVSLPAGDLDVDTVLAVFADFQAEDVRSGPDV